MVSPNPNLRGSPKYLLGKTKFGGNSDAIKRDVMSINKKLKNLPKLLIFFFKFNSVHHNFHVSEGLF